MSISHDYIFTENIDLIASYQPDIVLGSGRALNRHPNNQGALLTFDYWGKPKTIFIPDAKFRTSHKTYDSTAQSHGLHNCNVTGIFFADINENVESYSDQPLNPLPYTRTDKWIQTNFADLKNDGTAKENTDVLMTFETTEAAHYCRGLNFDGIGQCDLPNLYELIILYLESDNIDAIDPTVSEFSTYALGKANPNGRFNFNGLLRIWSSSECTTDLQASAVRYVGRCGNWGMQVPFGVIPVKEF